MLSFPHRLFTKKSTKVLRVGIIGLGRISDIHIRAFSRSNDVCIESLADINKDILSQKALSLGTQKISTDYRDILRDPSIDVVDILLPHFLHARVACEALTAGMHVICEKPLATDPRDVDDIARSARNAKRSVYLKQYFRFSALHQKVKEAIAKGAIGKPYLVSCCYTTDDRALYSNPLSWRGNIREAGGGIFMDVGVHIIDYLQELFGSCQTVSACMRKKFSSIPKKGEDVSVVTMGFRGGILANIICTAGDTSYGFRWEKHFYGTNGSLHLVDNGKSRMELRFQRNKHTEKIEIEKDWWDATNIRALDDIVHRIVHHQPPAISLTEAKNTLRVIQGAYISATRDKQIVFRRQP